MFRPVCRSEAEHERLQSANRCLASRRKRALHGQSDPLAVLEQVLPGGEGTPRLDETFAASVSDYRWPRGERFVANLVTNDSSFANQTQGICLANPDMLE